jgi:hypothetical protein
VASAAVSAGELHDHVSEEDGGSRPAVSLSLLTAPAPQDFGICQMCLRARANAVIGGQPWCRGCRDRYEVERPRGPFTE